MNQDLRALRLMEMGLTEMGLIRLRQLTAKAYAPSGYKAFSLANEA